MRRHRPAILVTGFGPFPGAPRNASSLLADAIADAAGRQLAGYHVHAATLPTEWHAGPEQLSDLLATLKPVLIVHFGVSHRARGFVIETRARNVCQDVPDACDATPAAACIATDGPSELAVTLPTTLIAARLRRLGLPVQLSRDAGGYLCNAILYHSLEHARRSALDQRYGANLGPRRGFIHIPDRLVAGGTGSARRSAPSRLDWSGAVRGGLAILAACVGER